MTRDAPWFKLHCRDWLDATRALDPHLRGLYVDVLCIMYDRDGPVPDDDAWLAHQLHVSKRAWRAARAALIAVGKLVETPDGLVNKRAILELESRAERRRINAENGAKNGPKNLEQLKKINTNNGASEPMEHPNGRYARADQNLEIDSDLNPPTPTLRAGARLTDKNFEKRTRQAASVCAYVTEDALDRVRTIAPGWDRQKLLSDFQAWPESKNARNPDAAFIGWVKKRTAGQPLS